MISVYSWRQAIQESTLSSTTKHVLLNLSCHINDRGDTCYPTIEMQMRHTGLSKNAIITHLQIACDAGFLLKNIHGFRGRRWRTNEYAPLFPSDNCLPNINNTKPEVVFLDDHVKPEVVILDDHVKPEVVILDDHVNPEVVILDDHVKNTTQYIEEIKKERREEKKEKIYIKKTNSKKSKTLALLTLREWEKEREQPLTIGDIAKYMQDQKVSRPVSEKLLEDFKERVTARGNQFADFTAAFKNWFRRGYLIFDVDTAKKMSQPKSRNEPEPLGLRL